MKKIHLNRVTVDSSLTKGPWCSNNIGTSYRIVGLTDFFLWVDAHEDYLCKLCLNKLSKEFIDGYDKEYRA